MPTSELSMTFPMMFSTTSPIDDRDPRSVPHVVPLLLAMAELLAALAPALEASAGARSAAAVRPCLAAYVGTARRYGVAPEAMLRRLRQALGAAAREHRASRAHYEEWAALVIPWALAEYFADGTGGEVQRRSLPAHQADTALSVSP